MKRYIDRREFLAASAYAATGLALGLSSCAKQRAPAEKTSHRRLKKALVVERPTEDLLRQVRHAGFDGVEAQVVSRSEAAEARKTAEKLHLRIHSVMRGWAKFNSPKAEEVESSLAVTVEALHVAKIYGADVVLLVPGRIDGMPMPNPWEYRVVFDKETGHVTAVADNDNGRYAEYMAAHNYAYDSFRTAILRLVATAEKNRVAIAIENVWNNLFVDPHHMANFVDSFNSPWVHAYFDIGNHVTYSTPQDWICVLGGRIVRCHVKDFRLNPDGRGGRFVNIRDGSVDWPIVIKALDDVGYRGWMTIEGSESLPLAERSRRLDLIIAGK